MLPSRDGSGVNYPSPKGKGFSRSGKIKFVHSIKTKRDYLATLGFVVYEDRLDPEDVELLGFIEEHYFHIELKPTLASEYEKVKYCNAPCLQHQN